MKKLSRPQIEAEAKEVKKQLYSMVITASKECRCVGKEIKSYVKRIVKLRELWKRQ